MPNMDYTKYAKVNNDAVEETVETIPEEVVEDVTEIVEEEPVVEPVVEEPVEETVEPEVVEEAPEPEIIPAPKFGRVFNCEKLNVRQAPKSDAPVVCELFRNAEVEIIEAESTNVFYRVCTASGITGFCMKTYILEK